LCLLFGDFFFDSWLNCGENNVIIFKCVTQLSFQILIPFLFLSL
jgi:hypothetical protein